MPRDTTEPTDPTIETDPKERARIARELITLLQNQQESSPSPAALLALPRIDGQIR